MIRRKTMSRGGPPGVAMYGRHRLRPSTRSHGGGGLGTWMLNLILRNRVLVAASMSFLCTFSIAINAYLFWRMHLLDDIPAVAPTSDQISEHDTILHTISQPTLIDENQLKMRNHMGILQKQLDVYQDTIHEYKKQDEARERNAKIAAEKKAAKQAQAEALKAEKLSAKQAKASTTKGVKGVKSSKSSVIDGAAAKKGVKSDSKKKKKKSKTKKDKKASKSKDVEATESKDVEATESRDVEATESKDKKKTKSKDKKKTKSKDAKTSKSKSKDGAVKAGVKTGAGPKAGAKKATKRH